MSPLRAPGRGPSLVRTALPITLFVASCRAPAPEAAPLSLALSRAPAVDVLVVAPHPDDEVLIAGGVMRRAVARGERVAIVVLTNGDYTCARDGYARERETVRAVARAGVEERDVHFLGYPDGFLASLGGEPRQVERRGPRGDCIRASTTYGDRGAAAHDAHTARTGAPAPYTSDALLEDLTALLTSLAPRDLYVTHAIDDHPDHAATYAFVRRALEHARPIGAALTIHRAVVHAGPCWPDGRERSTPCPAPSPAPGEVLPPLPEPLGDYLPRERVPIDGAWKLGAIDDYPSQTDGDASRNWLGAFARADEAFYPETLQPDPAAPGELRRTPSPGTPSGLVAPRGAWVATSSSRRTRDVAQRAPLRVMVSIAAGSDEAVAAVDVMRARASDDGYRLRVERRGTRAALERIGPGDPALLRAWSLPDDPNGGASHVYALRIDPRPDDGGVTELTLRRDGALVGVAVDPRPPPEGASLSVENVGGARVTDPEAAGEPR